MEETRTKIETLLEKVRPYVQGHGGDVRLIRIAEGKAVLTVDGACVDCPLADLTYNKVIRTLILEDVPEITEVVIE